MPIISARDNENNRWKKIAKKTNKKDKQTSKDGRERGGSGTEAIVKEWELNDFAVLFT